MKSGNVELKLKNLQIINTPKPPEIPIPVSKMHSQCKYVKLIFFQGGKAKKPKAVSNDEDRKEANKPCRKRKKYSDLELSRLDTVFLSARQRCRSKDH